MMADRVNPRISDQVICQVIDPAIVRASPSAERADVIGSLPSRWELRVNSRRAKDTASCASGWMSSGARA